MFKQIEKEYLPTDENTGKCYIDPDSTQVFIEALIKSKEHVASTDTKATELESAIG